MLNEICTKNNKEKSRKCIREFPLCCWWLIWSIEWCEKCRKPWQMGTRMIGLSKSFPMKTNMAGFKRFSKMSTFFTFAKSILSIERVNRVSWNLPVAGFEASLANWCDNVIVGISGGLYLILPTIFQFLLQHHDFTLCCHLVECQICKRKWDKPCIHIDIKLRIDSQYWITGIFTGIQFLRSPC